MSISVHDNILLSYSVDAEKREICLRTRYYDQERTDVIFTGVAAYHFEVDNFNTIIFDIEETTLEAIYDEHHLRFARLKNYGWPWVDTECPARESLLQYMRERGINAYAISSSCGLTGWVWAKEMVTTLVELTG